MASRRFELHEKLCEILGTRNVYFQPPETVKMKYPSIVYNRFGYRTFRADNGTYLKIAGYSVTFINDDPDEDLSTEMLDTFQYCSFDRAYTADNLHHNVYTVYY